MFLRAGEGYKYPFLLIFILTTGCAVGRVSAVPCAAEGFAIGRARLHATCTPGKSMEQPVTEAPKIAMPIAGCPGRYSYLHECIDDEEYPPVKPGNPGNLNVAKIDEGFVEISGGSPSTGFWSTAFDFLAVVATIFVAKFGI